MEVFSDKNVGGSATRIGSFCKILYKISTMMTVELGFPDTYRVSHVTMFNMSIL